MAQCYDCEKYFPSGSRARDQHCEATDHRPAHEYDTCHFIFSGEHASYQHMRATGHFTNGYRSGISGGDLNFECEVCNTWYRTDEDCNNHMITDHCYCRGCERFLGTPNNMNQHLNSRIHLGAPIKCPFCTNTFTTAAGMTHHVETRSCTRAPHRGRRELSWLIRARDRNDIISKHGIPPPSNDDVFIATEESWCGTGYICYRCHRVFALLNGLNQHLNSPAHQDPLYRCPKRSCGAEFKTLAATINHLESEACGAMKFEKVQQKIGDIISGDKLLRF